MIKAPLKKIEKNSRTVFLYIALILVSYLISNYFFYLEPYHLKIGDFMIYSVHVAFALSNILFMMAWLRDPGYLRKDKSIDFFQIIERFDPNHLCPECEVIRTERSRHCNICNRCVERFDHHCPWINNCVGTRNHGCFYLYIITTILYILLVVVVTITVLWVAIEKESKHGF